MPSRTDKTILKSHLDDCNGTTNSLVGAIVNDRSIKTDIKGLRYEGRTLKLENLRIGDSIHIKREKSNHYNYNNFSVIDENEDNLGNLPAELCNVIAPLYDAGYLTIEKSTVSFIEKIGERSRYAVQGILFIEMIMRIH